ncbi:DUF309 domain-containing protein [Bacillus sp. BGMRC 2118]|nr:DUF309 domain-containing protein [Bacillus sp. BGMRC 2118]
MYPSAYIDYLVHFHGDRDYFECHEVLEEYWKEDEPGMRKDYWVGFIQVAVSLYHHRRSNFGGARRMMKNALQIFEKEREAVRKLGLDEISLIELIHHQLTQLENKEHYKSINLPINDEKLVQLCIDRCMEKGIVWMNDSDLSNEFIINKHKLRDRTEVIEERKLQKKRKQRTFEL